MRDRISVCQLLFPLCSIHCSVHATVSSGMEFFLASSSFWSTDLRSLRARALIPSSFAAWDTAPALRFLEVWSWSSAARSRLASLLRLTGFLVVALGLFVSSVFGRRAFLYSLPLPAWISL